jgi:hypothetical protein
MVRAGVGSRESGVGNFPSPSPHYNFAENEAVLRSEDGVKRSLDTATHEDRDVNC